MYVTTIDDYLVLRSSAADILQYTAGSASVTFGKIKRKLKAKAAGSSGAPLTTPKKPAAGKSRTPRSSKRGATEDATGTPSKKGKKATKPANNDEDEEEFSIFKVKKEEVADINNGADVFFQEATAYAAADDDQT